jgi:hypothetical protein
MPQSNERTFDPADYALRGTVTDLVIMPRDVEPGLVQAYTGLYYSDASEGPFMATDDLVAIGKAATFRRWRAELEADRLRCRSCGEKIAEVAG